MNGTIAYALSKQYVADTADSLGSLKGAPCTIKSITEVNGGQKVTFEWIGTSGTKQTSEMTVKNGVSVTGVSDKGNGIFTLLLSDGSESEPIHTVKGDPFTYSDFTAEQLESLRGEKGYSPTITENADNTDSIYKLDVTTADGTFTTPNLKGTNENGDTSNVQLDETLTDNTKAAPAGMVGEMKKEIGSLSEEIANLQSGGKTTEAKTLMLSLFKAAVYNNPEMQVTVDALEQKWTGSGSSIYYIITNNLTNVSNSNSAGAVAENTSYSATLTVDSDYNLESVTVTMGGTDITSTAYTDGVIHISAVTGDVVITATARATIEARTVYFASNDSIVKNDGYMNKDGTIGLTTNVRYKVAELPYAEGTLIHTYCNQATIAFYPPFIFFDGANYTVPEYTTPTDYNYEITLSGQTGIEKVYVNMWGTTDGVFADDRFYYVTQ